MEMYACGCTHLQNYNTQNNYDNQNDSNDSNTDQITTNNWFQITENIYYHNKKITNNQYQIVIK